MSDPEVIIAMLRKDRDLRYAMGTKVRLEEGRMATYEAAAELDEALIQKHRAISGR